MWRLPKRELIESEVKTGEGINLYLTQLQHGKISAAKWKYLIFKVTLLTCLALVSPNPSCGLGASRIMFF